MEKPLASTLLKKERSKPLKFKVAFSSMFFRDSDEVTTRIPRCSGRLAKVVETATGPSSLASHGSGGGARSSERV